MLENAHQGYTSKSLKLIYYLQAYLCSRTYGTPVGFENFLFICNFYFSKIIGVWDLKGGHGKTLWVFIYKTLSTILPINCGKTIIWDENSLFWTPPSYPNPLFAFFENSDNPLHKLWQNYHLRRKFPFLNLLTPVSIFFSAGLQEKNFEIGGGGDNKYLDLFLPFCH